MQKSESGKCTTALSIVLLFLSSLACWPQSLAIGTRDRVVDAINEARRVVLTGQKHPLAKPEYLAGDVSPDFLMESMVLVLRADPAQDEALDELLQEQQDPQSPQYHRWLTPQTFGERFGVSPNDLARVTHWLETHGMRVNEIPASRRAIVFSGTAGQVARLSHFKPIFELRARKFLLLSTSTLRKSAKRG